MKNTWLGSIYWTLAASIWGGMYYLFKSSYSYTLGGVSLLVASLPWEFMSDCGERWKIINVEEPNNSKILRREFKYLP
jgi:hypothetical protein